MEMVVNPYGIRVKRCCASCAYKDLTRAKSLRRCNKHHRNVRPLDVCHCWLMSKLLKSVGKSINTEETKVHY